jgi:hypothetical protein
MNTPKQLFRMVGLRAEAFRRSPRLERAKGSPSGVSARGCRPAALENHSPGTSEALERPFELILDEFSCEVLEAYRTSKCAAGRTVPLMFRASGPNLAWPVAWLPRTVSSTLPGVHRPFLLTVAEPCHSPSMGPAAYASSNCDKNSKLAIEAMKRRRFFELLLFGERAWLAHDVVAGFSAERR